MSKSGTSWSPFFGSWGAGWSLKDSQSQLDNADDILSGNFVDFSKNSLSSVMASGSEAMVQNRAFQCDGDLGWSPVKSRVEFEIHFFHESIERSLSTRHWNHCFNVWPMPFKKELLSLNWIFVQKLSYQCLNWYLFEYSSSVYSPAMCDSCQSVFIFFRRLSSRFVCILNNYLVWFFLSYFCCIPSVYPFQWGGLMDFLPFHNFGNLFVNSYGIRFHISTRFSLDDFWTELISIRQSWLWSWQHGFQWTLSVFELIRVLFWSSLFRSGKLLLIFSICFCWCSDDCSRCKQMSCFWAQGQSWWSSTYFTFRDIVDLTTLSFDWVHQCTDYIPISNSCVSLIPYLLSYIWYSYGCKRIECMVRYSEGKGGVWNICMKIFVQSKHYDMR
jgi:hypothetical protein